MEVIYSILETILPFEFINYTFMKNALIAIILVSPIFAILGTMIVNNKMAFFSDALGHSAICGIAIGTILGISNVNISMIFFAIVFALLLNWVKNKTTYGADTIISVFSSIAIALGLAILAQSGNFNKYSSYLVGDILSITNVEILYVFLTFGLASSPHNTFPANEEDLFMSVLACIPYSTIKFQRISYESLANSLTL